MNARNSLPGTKPEFPRFTVTHDHELEPRNSVTNTRFTLDGSDAIESRIARDMKVVRNASLEAVGADSLSALILGGGYGRGEGGV